MASKDKSSDTQPSDVEIMMHLDGELRGADAERVAKFIASDEEAKTKATSLGQISELLQGSAELDADDAEHKLSQLWTGIDKAIHANGASSKSVAELAEESATDALVKTTKVSWFGGWGSHVMTGAFVAVAVAVLMMATRPDPVTNTTTVFRDAPAVAIPVILASQEPEVEELEVYDGSGVVMTVPGDDEEGGESSSTVIWITSDADLVEDPI